MPVNFRYGLIVVIPQNIETFYALKDWQDSRGGGRLHGMPNLKFDSAYEHIISLDNLLEAWQEFIRCKRNRKDTQEFERNLMQNIIALHDDLANKTYKHSEYEAFNISDPKPRNIHKAKVRDRLLHHAIYRILYPYFDRGFSSSSYSCRLGKGTHRALDQFRKYAYKASRNHSETVWILKCDIRKFFASIDQEILMKILQKHIQDQDIIWLLGSILSRVLAARSATDQSHSPYSNFCVGCAIQLKNGEVRSGANQENASYGMCLCAERGTIFAAHNEGHKKDISKIAVTARPAKILAEEYKGHSPVAPCGACRQVIKESEDLAGERIIILMDCFDDQNIARVEGIEHLLPLAFGPSDLLDLDLIY